MAKEPVAGGAPTALRVYPRFVTPERLPKVGASFLERLLDPLTPLDEARDEDECFECLEPTGDFDPRVLPPATDAEPEERLPWKAASRLLLLTFLDLRLSLLERLDLRDEADDAREPRDDARDPAGEGGAECSKDVARVLTHCA